MFKRRSKYNNKITIYNGITFHSSSEAKYAEILDGLVATGRIRSYTRQVRYPLPNREGKMRLAVISDFNVIKNDGTEVIIDVKGVLTDATNIKLAYFKHYYNKEVILVRTTGLEKFKIDFLLQ